MRVLGVDGCKSGWVGVRWDDSADVLVEATIAFLQARRWLSSAHSVRGRARCVTRRFMGISLSTPVPRCRAPEARQRGSTPRHARVTCA